MTTCLRTTVYDLRRDGPSQCSTARGATENWGNRKGCLGVEASAFTSRPQLIEIGKNGREADGNEQEKEKGGATREDFRGGHPS